MKKINNKYISQQTWLYICLVKILEFVFQGHKVYGTVFVCREEIRDLTTTKQRNVDGTPPKRAMIQIVMCVYSCTEMVKNPKVVQLHQHKANKIGFPVTAILMLVKWPKI